MRIFFDFEFDTYEGKTFPISLGAVREDGNTLHVRFPFERRFCSNWILRNVIPHLKEVKESPREEIQQWLKDFTHKSPEFWANYGAYDWYLLCEIYGGLMKLPEGWPSYYNELQMLKRITGKPEPQDSWNDHNALNDALWNKRLYESLSS